MFFRRYRGCWSLSPCSRRRIPSLLQGTGCNFDAIFSQKDGDRPHYEYSVRCAKWTFWRQWDVEMFSWAWSWPPYYPVLNHATSSYEAPWKLGLQKQYAQNLRAETRSFGSSDQRQWRKSGCSCVKFQTAAADGHGCRLWTYWKRVNLPRPLNSEMPNTAIFAI
jgi:hypothetical protein